MSEVGLWTDVPLACSQPLKALSVKMSDPSTVEGCKERFVRDLDDLYKYQDFKKILHCLRGSNFVSTPSPPYRVEGLRVKDILEQGIQRKGAIKVSRKERKGLLENAKALVAKNEVWNTENSFIPDECLAKTIANELSWPKCVPKKVVDAEKALLVAQSTSDGSPGSINAVTTASKHLDSSVRQWKDDTVGKSRQEYLKALMEEPVDISV